jgi:hypothetical protein
MWPHGPRELLQRLRLEALADLLAELLVSLAA